jgi:hypothetical protein
MRHHSEGTWRIDWNASTRCLQRHEPTESSGNANRSGNIGSDRCVTDAGGQGCGRTAARASWRPFRVPGISGDARQRGIGHAFPAEFRRGRLAKDNGSLLSHACHCRRIFGPSLVRVDKLRSRQRRPPFCEDRILDSNRHAIELAKAGLAVPSRLRLPCLNKNLLSIGRTHEDVQIYTPLCAIEACLCDFDRGQRSLLVHLGNLSRAQIRNFSCHPYLAYEQCASVKLTSFSLSRQRAPLPLVGRSWGWMYLRDPVQTTTPTLAAPHKAQGGGSRPSLLLSVSIALRAVFTLRRETVPARALSQAAR